MSTNLLVNYKAERGEAARVAAAAAFARTVNEEKTSDFSQRRIQELLSARKARSMGRAPRPRTISTSSVQTCFSITGDVRILATTVDDDAALDRGSVVAIDMHFTRAASEALARIVGGFALRIGRCKRWLDTRSLKRNPRAFEFIAWANLDDFHP
jgi:hypothetical protein